MGKPHTTAVNKYNLKVYDRVSLMLPKGRKAELQAYAKEQGTTLIGLINELLREHMGYTDEEWNARK